MEDTINSHRGERWVGKGRGEVEWYRTTSEYKKKSNPKKNQFARDLHEINKIPKYLIITIKTSNPTEINLIKKFHTSSLEINPIYNKTLLESIS